MSSDPKTRAPHVRDSLTVTTMGSLPPDPAPPPQRIWGLIPAAGAGSRIQPLAFSKELLPVGSRTEDGQDRPRAVSEYLIERMILAGATHLCFVISPGKADILSYFGSRVWGADIAYIVQPSPGGLCDALFRAIPFIHPEDQLLIGLPDTIWTPENAFSRLPPDRLAFLLFPVENPQHFDAVLTDEHHEVLEIQVKSPHPTTHWIWGALRMTGEIFHSLHALWCRPDRRDEYLGTLVNAWLTEGGRATAVPCGEAYVDTGTLHGYRQAIALLDAQPQPTSLSTQTRPPNTSSTPATDPALLECTASAVPK